jgi:hypothetical protein
MAAALDILIFGQELIEKSPGTTHIHDAGYGSMN